MRMPFFGRGLSVLLLASSPSPALIAQSVIFTNDTAIAVGETNYDGAAVIVTNCTVTRGVQIDVTPSRPINNISTYQDILIFFLKLPPAALTFSAQTNLERL